MFLLLIVGKHFKFKKKLIQTYPFKNFIDTEHPNHHQTEDNESIVEKINEFFDSDDKNEDDENDLNDITDEE